MIKLLSLRKKGGAAEKQVFNIEKTRREDSLRKNFSYGSRTNWINFKEVEELFGEAEVDFSSEEEKEVN